MRIEADIHVPVGGFDVEASIVAGHDDVVAIVGPNGAGKTTLLHGLAGLLESAGPRMVPEPVGMVFQDRRLFPHLTVRDNVGFRAASLADAWLDRVGLLGKAGARPGELSGGEAQRVALARTLAHSPKCLLLDEPFTALDVESRAIVRTEIERFAGPRVLVTHHPLDAASLASQVIVLEAGRVVQRGSLRELAAQPRSQYVADLVGVNWLPGTGDGETVELVAGGRLVAAGPVPAGPVAAVVHPRAVALYAQAPAGSPRNVVAGRVRRVEPHAGGLRVSVDGPPPLVAEVTAGAVADLGLAPGRPVWCVLKASEVTVAPL